MSVAVQAAVSNGAMQSEPTFKRKNATRPVDLVHLSRQSLGDRALEGEILALFASQSSLYLNRLSCATTAEERKMAAHTILGSARGIGAWMVAEEAQKVEWACTEKVDLSSLQDEVRKACDYIAEILTD